MQASCVMQVATNAKQAVSVQLDKMTDLMQAYLFRARKQSNIEVHNNERVSHASNNARIDPLELQIASSPTFWLLRWSSECIAVRTLVAVQTMQQRNLQKQREPCKQQHRNWQHRGLRRTKRASSTLININIASRAKYNKTEREYSTTHTLYKYTHTYLPKR